MDLDNTIAFSSVDKQYNLKIISNGCEGKIIILFINLGPKDTKNDLMFAIIYY